MSIKDELSAIVVQTKRTIEDNQNEELEVLRSAIAPVIESGPIAVLADQLDAVFNSIYYNSEYGGSQLKAFKLAVEAFNLAPRDRPGASGIEYLAAAKLLSSSSLLGDDIHDDILKIFDVSIDGEDGSAVTNIPLSVRGRGPSFHP
jgi:hypothetical protein